MTDRIKVIFDTDPGVDDTFALVYALLNPKFDVKLISISAGNIDIDKTVRNMCHILDLLNLDIPVVKGYERFGTNTEDAAFLHGEEGLGGYIPPQETKHKPLNKDCADVTYDVLKQNPNEITFCVMGPHTNLANLLIKYPDSKNLIKQVIMMGGSVDGTLINPNHISFNIRTDAQAFRTTVESNLPVIMCPSRIGRDEGYLSEKMVKKIENQNEMGKFFVKTFETYWEPDYPDKRIATCDISTIYYLLYPKFYKTKRAFIFVDTQEHIGKTTAAYSDLGNFKLITKLNRRKFIQVIMKELKMMDNIKLKLQ